MRLGYNTNGTSDHRWAEAIELMADIGYRSVAITVDHHCLDPFSPRLTDEVASMRSLLERLGMISIIETGARFLLNPHQKHEPTLMSATQEERAVRIDFLKRCIDIADSLGATAVSFWSGILRDESSRDVAMGRLAQGCRDTCEYAATRNVRLAFEPEPGMFIESMADYDELLKQVDATHFGLTIDIGHLQCVEDEPIPVHLHRWADRIFNIHIEDMVRGVHEHLPFGEGEIDFPPVIAALSEIGYEGGVHVELSRHSHMAPQMLQNAFDFLHPLLRKNGASG